MRHVFVETNFLVELLRPLPSRDAERLFSRNDGVNLRLYVPWCSQSEAFRTLSNAIIKADLGFTDVMMKFALSKWVANNGLFDKGEIEKLKALAEHERDNAFRTLDQRIADRVAKMVRIDPSPEVVARTLRVFSVKSLKPFDEMVLGAVLTKATELHVGGEKELVFCNLDSDLASKHPLLRQEYAACGLTVRQDFRVP